jgi:type I restriction enzyme S subunit
MKIPWLTKKLGEVCEKYFSGIWGEEPIKEGNTFVIRVSDIKEGGIIDYSEVPLRWVDPQKLKKFQLQEGDLLVVKSSGSKAQIISGRTAIFENKTSRVFCPSNFLLTLRPNKEKVLPKWLWLYLNGPEAKKFVEKIIGATTYPNIRPADYLNLEIPIPPLEIQKRIVARIEELFEKIDKAKQLREKALEETEQIFPLTLEHIFRKAEEKYKKQKIEEILELNQSGIWGDEPTDLEDSYPIIRSTEITYEGKLKLESVVFRKVNKEKVDKYVLREGDILIVKSSGSPGLIGRCTLFRQSKEDKKIYLFSNFIQRLRPNAKIVTSEFLYYFLNFEGKKFVQYLMTTTTGLRNLPIKQYVKLEIPLPPLSEQKKIVAYLDNLREKIDKLKQLQQKQLEELTELKNSILEKAFTGELI